MEERQKLLNDIERLRAENDSLRVIHSYCLYMVAQNTSLLLTLSQRMCPHTLLIAWRNR